MNIAFVIGNSDYDKLNKLEACKNDIKAIGDVLKATGKYGKIFIEENKRNDCISKNSSIHKSSLCLYFTYKI